MMTNTGGMRQRVLEEAQRLLQTRGYDGFSYADVSEAVGIRKASIHHHFPTKGDLAAALVAEFRAACGEALAAIDRKAIGPSRRLAEYARVFQKSLEDENRMCLTGMMAAGQSTLPEEVRAALAEAVADHERWLTGVLKDGQQAGEIRPDVPAAKLAQLLFAALEGAMLFARIRGGPANCRAAARTALASVASAPASAP